TLTEPRLSRSGIAEDRQNLPSIHGGAGDRGQARHAAGAGGFHLVLHLHRFHDNQALTRFHLIAGRYQHTHNLARHGSRYDLDALRAKTALLAAPAAWIDPLHAELAAGYRDMHSIHSNVVAAAVEQHGVDARLDFSDIRALL